MERKVIQLAGKTLVVSLPCKWAKTYGVKKGDTIIVEEKDSTLEIKTSKSKDIEKIHLKLEGPYEFIKRNIGVSYKKGADELDLSFDDAKIRKIIDEVMQSTMGFEIISIREKGCIIKSIATVVEGEFDNILRRTFLTLLSMAEESQDAISKSQFQRLKEIKMSDDTINKLTNFCKRILNKNGYKDEKLSNYIYCIVWEIERIGDEYQKICDIQYSKKSKISKEIIELHKETNEFLRDFYNLFYKFSQESGIKFTNKRNLLYKKSKSLIPKTYGEEAIIVHHLANIITSVYDIAGPYYAMVL